MATRIRAPPSMWLSCRTAVVCVAVIPVVLAFLMPSVSGHGRLRVPASRASAWRDGFNTPTNYQDNELFCGGFSHQVSLGGLCGICGDPYDGVRAHEAGGTYATGTITATYEEDDQMLIAIQITAHHKGWFEFRLCANNDPTVPATEACLDAGLLTLADHFPGSTRYETPVNTPSGWHNITVYLPTDLTCSQCVLQWKYNAGNSWGTDPDTGESCVGCGPQEQFYGCSDIAILPRGGPIEPQTDAPPRETTEGSSEEETDEPSWEETDAPPRVTEAPPVQTEAPPVQTEAPPVQTEAPVAPGAPPSDGDQLVCESIGAWEDDQDMEDWCNTNCNAGYCPETHCLCRSGSSSMDGDGSNGIPNEERPVAPTERVCEPTGVYRRAPGMQNWCTSNCKRGNCPRTHCVCREVSRRLGNQQRAAAAFSNGDGNQRTCQAIGPWRRVSGMHKWCMDNCNMAGGVGNCPATRCMCD